MLFLFPAGGYRNYIMKIFVICTLHLSVRKIKFKIIWTGYETCMVRGEERDRERNRERETQCMNISLGYSQHNKHWESGISCRIISKLFIKKQEVRV